MRVIRQDESHAFIRHDDVFKEGSAFAFLEAHEVIVGIGHALAVQGQVAVFVQHEFDRIVGHSNRFTRFIEQLCRDAVGHDGPVIHAFHFYYADGGAVDLFHYFDGAGIVESDYVASPVFGLLYIGHHFSTIDGIHDALNGVDLSFQCLDVSLEFVNLAVNVVDVPFQFIIMVVTGREAEGQSYEEHKQFK